MGLTNAEKQAAHRVRMRAKGFVQIHAWATPAQAAAIRAILSGEAAAVPNARQPESLPVQPASRSTRRKKSSPPPRSSGYKSPSVTATSSASIRPKSNAWRSSA